MIRRVEGLAPEFRPNGSASLRPRLGWLIIASVLLTACGGGGSDGGGGGSNNAAPVASFTTTPASGAAPLAVSFDAGASSDSDGTISSYAWNFGDGTTGSGVAPGHTFVTAGTYTVTLTVTDDDGATGSTTRSVSASDSGSGNVTVSGRITYERVPFSSDTSRGLDYAATVALPAREIVVELLDASTQAVIASTTTDSSGQYAVATAANTSVIVRARAETKRASPAWDIRVLDNTNSNALYVLDSAAFNTGTASQTKNLLADSGWAGFGGTSYTTTRAAAPFAILDTLYSAVQFLLSEGNASQNLPPLDVYWNPQNASTATWDPATGAIVTTAYRPDVTSGFPAGIYVLGLQNNDTDEYDEHVLAHEFNHFLEDKISRTDTMGGSHSTGARLDMRLAFSEGLANAFSAMVLGNARYSDSNGSQQASRYTFDMESGTNTPAGWYNEGTVASVVWDLYDAQNDDGVAIGYQPMYEAFVNQLKTGPALTSIFPFAAALEARTGAPVAAIDALLTSHGINGTDAYATGETNGGGIAEALPLYTNIGVGGTQRVCGSATAGSYNGVGNRRYLRFSLGAAMTVTIKAVYTSAGSSAPLSPTADPDLVLYRSGAIATAESSDPNTETLGPGALEAGDYVIEVYDYSHVDLSSGASRRGVTCFNVSLQ